MAKKRGGKRKVVKLPEIINEFQLKQFFETFNQKTKTGFRNYVLFYLLTYSGMRISEALDMQYEDIKEDVDKDGNKIYFYFLRKSKSGKQAKIFIPLNIYKMIIKLNDLYGSRRRGFVFRPVRENSRMKDSYFRRICAEKGEEINVGFNLHPHTFRHYFATQVLKKTGDIFVVKELLRHADIGSTQIYLHMDISKGIDVVNSLFD